MNPMNLMKMMGNPQQFLQNMMNNNQIMQNPMARNAMEMARRGDSHGIEQMARNLCREKGMDADDVMRQVKEKFNL